MRKYTMIILLTLGLLQTKAQDYLISFAGIGAITSVGSVKVENLTKTTSVTLNGTDVLHLKASLGIETKDIDNGTLRIYPNPMTEQSMLTLIAPKSGNAVIHIVDVYGKFVYQISTLLSRGTHSFRVSGINQGIYFVKVAGVNYNYSVKLMSQSNLQSQATIEYVSSDKNSISSLLKSTTATIDMPYTNGDQLIYKGLSGIYSTIVTDVPTSSKTITFNFVACTDIEGNNYTIVEIDAQVWMAENLNVGARINGLVEQTNNSIIEKYCYDDNDSNCAVFGGLYQWDEAMQYSTTPGIQGICPTGWHFPADGEWTTLTTYLGGESIAGAKMKETGPTHWLSPNTETTNNSGFTAVPAGYHNIDGTFGEIGYAASWGSSSEYDTYDAWIRLMGHGNDVLRNNYYKNSGFSVRCLRD